MGHQQCGLCLSCGTPFMPIADDVDLFNHKGTLCVLYLHQEYKQNRTLQRQYELLRFASDRQSSHVFHDSHHFPAINHMCNHHTGDSDVDWPAPHAGLIPPGNTVIPPGPNGPLPYFKNPTSATTKGPSIATWTRPPAAQRLDFSPLLNHIVTAADLPDARPVVQNLDERLFICRGCNAIMTQLNNMEFHLGITRMRGINARGPLIAGPVVRQYVANMRGASLPNAYGRWSKTAAAPSLNPRGNPSDDVSPHVAYYLHMCLPFVDPAHPDPFAATIATANMRGPARILYLELSWIILEIACVATLRDQGKLYAPVGARSHGPHQHSGVLDIYVSYFLFRLLQFESGRQVQREGLDFVQWHQKYYCDAINCKDLFPAAARPAVLATNAYTTTLQPSPTLVVDICQGLMHMYTVELLRLRLFLTRNRVGLPVEITAYFLPLVSMRELRRRSGIRVISGDFQSALLAFGAAALLSRAVQLCEDCPAEFWNQLLSFRQDWQLLEIERIRANSMRGDGHMRTAHTQYLMCSMLQPPDDLPSDKAADAIESAELCSPWTAVLPLDSVGAFRIPVYDD